MASPRRRVPRWHLIAYTSCGVPVYAPANAETRRAFFRDSLAFVDESGRVFARSRSLWLRSPALRRHEEMHLKQMRVLGRAVFFAAYRACNQLVGYAANPFEMQARGAERARP